MGKDRTLSKSNETRKVNYIHMGYCKETFCNNLKYIGLSKTQKQIFLLMKNLEVKQLEIHNGTGENEGLYLMGENFKALHFKAEKEKKIMMKKIQEKFKNI